MLNSFSLFLEFISSLDYIYIITQNKKEINSQIAQIYCGIFYYFLYNTFFIKYLLSQYLRAENRSIAVENAAAGQSLTLYSIEDKI